MKKKLLLILFTFILSLGIFGASFSLDSFASGVYSTPFTLNGYTLSTFSDWSHVEDWGGNTSVPFVVYFNGASTYIYFKSSTGFTFRTPSDWVTFSSRDQLLNVYFGPVFNPFSSIAYTDLDSALNALNNYSPSSFDEDIILKSYFAYWLGGLNSVVPVLYGSVSDNVDHIDVELFWDDVDSSPIASYTINPLLGKFFNLGASVPYIGMQGHKMIYKLVPYSVSGNYGATYYSTVTSFNLNNTRYVDFPKASGNGTGRLDFNSYTQSVNSYSPTSNINQSTVLDTYYNRTYNNDYSTSEEFYNEYDYSTVDKSYLSNNQLTFNTNIEINFPQLDGDWLKNLFQTFNFNLPTDLMNHWIPGVPNWVVDIIIAGIAIIVAAVIAKLLFTIL